MGKVYEKIKNRSLTAKEAVSSPRVIPIPNITAPRYDRGGNIVKVDKQAYVVNPKIVKASHEDLLASTFKDFVLRTWKKQDKK